MTDLGLTARPPLPARRPLLEIFLICRRGSSANILDEYVGIIQTYPLDLQAHPLPSEALAYPVIPNLIWDPVVCGNVAI